MSEQMTCILICLGFFLAHTESTVPYEGSESTVIMQLFLEALRPGGSSYYAKKVS